MRFDSNPQLREELLLRLRQKYLTTRPEIPHLSEIMYCLTRSYYDRIDPIPPSDSELMLFSVGFGLEEVLLRDRDNPKGPVTEQLDGIWLTPDYVALEGGELDLKTTRMGLKRLGSDMSGCPDTWIEQFKAYAYKMRAVQTFDFEHTGLPETIPYSVGVLLLSSVPPELVVGTFTFTRQELLDNWKRMQGRKSVYLMFLALKTPPPAFEWNKGWECQYCRYIARCTTYKKEHQNAGS